MEMIIGTIVLSLLLLILAVENFRPRKDFRVWLDIKSPVIKKLYLAGFELRSSSIKATYYDFYQPATNIGVLIVKGGDIAYIRRGREPAEATTLEELDKDFFNLIIKEKF